MSDILKSSKIDVSNSRRNKFAWIKDCLYSVFSTLESVWTEGGRLSHSQDYSEYYKIRNQFEDLIRNNIKGSETKLRELGKDTKQKKRKNNILETKENTPKDLTLERLLGLSSDYEDEIDLINNDCLANKDKDKQDSLNSAKRHKTSQEDKQDSTVELNSEDSYFPYEGLSIASAHFLAKVKKSYKEGGVKIEPLDKDYVFKEKIAIKMNRIEETDTTIKNTENDILIQNKAEGKQIGAVEHMKNIKKPIDEVCFQNQKNEPIDTTNQKHLKSSGNLSSDEKQQVLSEQLLQCKKCKTFYDEEGVKQFIYALKKETLNNSKEESTNPLHFHPSKRKNEEKDNLNVEQKRKKHLDYKTMLIKSNTILYKKTKLEASENSKKKQKKNNELYKCKDKILTNSTSEKNIINIKSQPNNTNQDLGGKTKIKETQHQIKAPNPLCDFKSSPLVRQELQLVENTNNKEKMEINNEESILSNPKLKIGNKLDVKAAKEITMLKPYSCPSKDCPKRYRSKNGLKYHLKHEHIKDSIDEQI